MRQTLDLSENASEMKWMLQQFHNRNAIFKCVESGQSPKLRST